MNIKCELKNVIEKYKDEKLDTFEVSRKAMASDCLKEINRLEDKVLELEYEITGVMYFVEKWLSKEELELNLSNVNKADFVRGKMLRIMEEAELEIIQLKERIESKVE